MAPVQKADASSNYLKDFCDKYGLNYPSAIGIRLTPGGQRDDYSLTPVTPNVDASTGISAIRLKPVGRFGNNIHQILNAHFIAQEIGIEKVLCDRINLPWFGEENTSKTSISTLPETGLILEGGFFLPWTFNKYIKSLNANSMLKIATEIL